jgi:hypothetical protein
MSNSVREGVLRGISPLSLSTIELLKKGQGGMLAEDATSFLYLLLFALLDRLRRCLIVESFIFAHLGRSGDERVILTVVEISKLPLPRCAFRGSYLLDTSARA